MKKLLPMLAILILLLPALVAAAEPLAAQPSLEALRAAIFEPVDPAAAPAGAGFKASCTVSNNCGPHSPTISCTSPSGNCVGGPSWVECDGVRKNCAPCRVSTTCGGGGGFSCTGTTINNCEIEPHCFVVCNGVFFGSCPVCP